MSHTRKQALGPVAFFDRLIAAFVVVLIVVGGAGLVAVVSHEAA